MNEPQHNPEEHPHKLVVPPAAKHAVQDAVDAIADVALAPVQEVLGKALWLRYALVCHLLSTLVATVIALRHDFADWQVYAWTGLLTAVLIGNFMRWSPDAGWFHRASTTFCALIVDLVWLILLYDRARVGTILHPLHKRDAWSADSSPWFWLPVLLLTACASLLVAHAILAPRHRLRHTFHKNSKQG